MKLSNEIDIVQFSKVHLKLNWGNKENMMKKQLIFALSNIAAGPVNFKNGLIDSGIAKEILDQVGPHTDDQVKFN